MDQIPDCVKIQVYGESHESFVFAILYNFSGHILMTTHICRRRCKKCVCSLC